MNSNLDIYIEDFCCPFCSGNVEIIPDLISCINCGTNYPILDDIPLTFLQSNDHCPETQNIINKEKLFYEDHPFPNYDDYDSPGSLVSKANKSIFANKLNDELGFNSKILEVGCGTGQLTNYLSLSNRYVIGADISYSSLKLGNEFKKKFAMSRNTFVQMNLFRPPFKEDSFDTIICNGVLHHTPDPKAGFVSLLKLLKKNGYIIIGLYNKIGRAYTHLRRLVFNTFGKKSYILDPHLRRKDISEKKKYMWYMDQYKNPLETTHSFDEVLQWFDATNVEYINTIPNILYQKSSSNYKLLEKYERGTYLSRILTQIKILSSSNSEGGFFIMIGKKR